MIKGYFPVSLYAKMSGISVDTAWHRVLRNKVESIIGKDGERYVYYEKSTLFEKNYISFKDYANCNGISVSKLRHMLSCNQFPEGIVVRKECAGKNTRWYIRKDYTIKNLTAGSHADLFVNKPEGYSTMSEWAKKNKLAYSTAHVYASCGIIPSIKVCGHRYIPNDYTYERKRKKGAKHEHSNNENRSGRCISQEDLASQSHEHE